MPHDLQTDQHFCAWPSAMRAEYFDGCPSSEHLALMAA